MSSELSVTLEQSSSPQWVDAVLKNFDAFLVDHAACERKASSVGMSFVVRYPDRVKLLEPMIQYAREELEHFHQVYRLIESRGLTLGDDSEDKYVAPLMSHVRTGRNERFLDRLIVSALFEARGAERLGLLSEKLPDDALRAFYLRLTRAEHRHRDFFLEMAALYFSSEDILSRLEFFTPLEQAALDARPLRPALY